MRGQTSERPDTRLHNTEQRRLPRPGAVPHRGGAKRKVWVGSDGFAYDGERLRDYSRAGS